LFPFITAVNLSGRIKHILKHIVQLSTYTERLNLHWQTVRCYWNIPKG